MCEMINLMFRPCSLCSEIDHLIHEVEFLSSHILTTSWNADAAETEGTLSPAVERAMKSYEWGELSTDSHLREERLVRTPQSQTHATSRHFIEDQRELGRFCDAYKALEGNRENPLQAESESVQLSRDSVEVLRSIAMHLENNVSTRSGVRLGTKTHGREPEITMLASKKTVFRRLSLGIKRRMRRMLG